MGSDGLRSLGWKPFFVQQMQLPDEGKLVVARIGAHWGSQVLCLTGTGELSLPIALLDACGPMAVGDWVLLNPQTHRGVRRLQRQTLLQRKAAGEKVQAQLIAANLDTLFIVSSCNADFNLSRLERYLALAIEAEVVPVVVLTKSDLCDDPHSLRQEVERLRSDLIVEALDARSEQDAAALADWCGSGRTVALVGSSGVGKSTLAMTLGAGHIATQRVREDDAKGRHTTTARAIHRLSAGGLLVDTPGMRELQLADCETGVAEVFDELLEIARGCRFRDCTHQQEPDCAVQQAIAEGELDPRRLHNYRKLKSEQRRNAQSLREQHQESRQRGRFYKSIQNAQRDRKG